MEFSPRPVLDDVTVLIPTLGRELLRGCLHAIAHGTAWPARLIVVDQSSSEAVSAWLEDLRRFGLQAEHWPSSKTGAAAARNLGLVQVQTRFVALTDDDCHAQDDWLQTMVSMLRRASSTIITGRVEPGGIGAKVAIRTSRTSVTYTRPLLKEDVLDTNNMGCVMDIFDKVGAFDERLHIAAEDNDWSYRALREGVPILYAPQVVVTHQDWRDAADLMITYRRYARGQGQFYGKHLRRGDPFIALRVAVAFARAIVRWLRGVLARDEDLMASGHAVLTQLLPGIVEGTRPKK